MRRLLTPLVVLTLLLTGVTPAVAAVAKVWTADSWQRVFRTDQRPATVSTSINWDAARNEAESYQILLRHTASFTIMGVSFSALTGSAGTIAADKLEYKFQNHHAPEGGQLFPDPLGNERSTTVAANTTQGIWVTVNVPAGQAAGAYTGSADVATSTGAIAVPVRLTVYPVDVPNAVDSKYIYSTWNVFFNEYADDSGDKLADEIVDRYHFTRYSPQWWKLMEDFAKEQKATRQNQVHISIDPLLDGPTTLVGNTYHFDWSKFDQFVELFIQHGSVARLRGNPLLNALYTDKVWIIDNVNGKAQVRLAPVRSPEADRWLDQYLPALKAHLDAKGWTGIWHQTISDEPKADKIANYNWAVGKYRQYFGAQAKTQDAVIDVFPDLVDHVSVWIPLVDRLQENQQFYRDRQAAGDEVWTYVCLQPDPRDGWLNRWSTYPAYTARQLAWGNFKYGATGFFHWGYNAWTSGGYGGVEPYPGDGYIVYPDVPRGTVRTSVRSLATRDGNEEYELLTILKRRDPAAAQRLADALMTGYDNFTDDTDLMAKTRKELLLRAAGAAVPARVEAETGQLTGTARLDTVGTGYTGTGYAGWLDQAAGSSATVDVTAARPGPQVVEIRYSNGTDTSNTLTLLTNGAAPRKVAFLPTGDWNTTWSSAYATVDLLSGANTITLRHEADDGSADPDSLTLW
ncbi:DUF4091 domain-containing protein [Kribbella antibiotica]|uniref:DUF4091 domain-containing protein n=1 Tax=Kribbella antibiotica TaxID=190195 RepID=A0A4R4ZM33_9ACTN|nr:glycoside hydrolase domain-containing protein [Kribbella antibiotica]TDD57902.1 DUF4091 domain-containing protein [Kribbella antibiotica]